MQLCGKAREGRPIQAGKADDMIRAKDGIPSSTRQDFTLDTSTTHASV